MSSVPIMVSDGRRVCGRKRRREDRSGRAERDSGNSKSAKSHGNSLSCWAAQQRRGNTPFAPERYAHHTMKPPSQVGKGENYPSFDSPDRGVDSLILAFSSERFFAMFAEDIGLLSKDSFTVLLKRQKERPELLHHQLWASAPCLAMSRSTL